MTNPSDDLVERLRQFALDIANGAPLGNIIVLDAASEIAKQRLRIKELESWRAGVYERAETAERKSREWEGRAVAAEANVTRSNAVFNDLNGRRIAAERERDEARYKALTEAADIFMAINQHSYPDQVVAAIFDLRDKSTAGSAATNEAGDDTR